MSKRPDRLDRQDQIFATALRLFVQKGLQATSMGKISEESGVAVGTIYLHFKSKDELIQALYAAVNKSFGQAILLSEEEYQQPIPERIKLVFKKAYDYYSANPLHFVYHNSIIYSPFMNNELRNEIRQNYKQSIDTLQEGIDSGLIVDQQMVLLMRFCYNTIISLVQIKNEIEVTPEMEAKHFDMIWRGLAR